MTEGCCFSTFNRNDYSMLMGARAVHHKPYKVCTSVKIFPTKKFVLQLRYERRRIE